ncbi:MAG: hypothetical protein PHQ09_05850 [Actinomycetota bacterium]|nr:hypothetical protein [Actinomycetota bacterium]
MKKIIIFILAMILFLGLIPISSGCTPELIFENIVISSDIETDTYKPLDIKTEFDTSAEHIYATIEYSGTKGGDIWRFKWTNLDTEEIVLDKEDQYDPDQKEKYMAGIVETDIYPLDESSIIPPGDYKIEFYNNGEIIKTTTFKVNKPRVKIIEVSLANQINEMGAPVAITQEFKSNETVYACVKVDFQTTGNTVKAQWKSSTGKLLTEASLDMIEYPDPSYLTYSFQWETGVIPAGSYKVEIYLNDSLYGSFDFRVTEETAETAGATTTFDQGIQYSSTDFGFTITIPDNWTYEESKTAQGEISLSIIPPSQDTPVFLQFNAVYPELYLPYEDFADNDSANFAEQQDWTFVENDGNDAVLENGTPCKEYYYSYMDNDNTSWTMAYCFAENDDKLYLLIVITDENNSIIAKDAYVGILNSLVFN